VTSTDATIEAQINTGGHTTTYEVWVGRYPECIEESALACESSGGGPAGTGAIVGTIAAGSSSPTSISVDAKAWHALKPNSEYIYSVSATNSNWSYEGSTYGPPHVFKTAAAPLPVIENESFSHLPPTDAALEATINDQGLEATYTFYLQGPIAPCLEADPPCMIFERAPVALPAGTLLGSFLGQSVSADLNSAGITLEPGGHYRYWVTATTSADTTDGADQVLIAPNEPASPATTVTPSIGTPAGGPLTTPSLHQAGSDGGTHTTVLAPTSGATGTHGHPARMSKICKHKPHKNHPSCLKHDHKHGNTASPTNKH
jgi:hypothetical protein